MTRLLYFTRAQEKRREGGGGVMCLGMEEKGDLYSSGRENMNERLFIEG